MQFYLRWVDQAPLRGPVAETQYPHGVEVDLSCGAPKVCRIGLPWPAKGCGLHIVVCLHCDQSTLLRASGRHDDPRSVVLPCTRKEAR